MDEQATALDDAFTYYDFTDGNHEIVEFSIMDAAAILAPGREVVFIQIGRFANSEKQVRIALKKQAPF